MSELTHDDEAELVDDLNVVTEPAETPIGIISVGRAEAERSIINIDGNEEEEHSVIIIDSEEEVQTVIEIDGDDRGEGSSADDATSAVPGIDECPLCYNTRRNMAFQCGHIVCATCGYKISECCLCRKPIKMRTILFL
jgi:hypothetical protein